MKWILQYTLLIVVGFFLGHLYSDEFWKLVVAMLVFSALMAAREASLKYHGFADIFNWRKK